ncbi:hypothetical protein U0C82_06095 [Fulvimarina sp. 2208YS6-2-32]|uniref:Uncharacterized protein n=1 Tax=Fulvimarina uroteuthidis TaxID=3098149 RepID=A0ABU5I014_9HYPH|nr:hypothetical protein [Fulvimarina sp. 2208YS6-2-32]MDY8108718.1 hypothetical protein [Fulvimarina sp. 2208YS6-2-32]
MKNVLTTAAFALSLAVLAVPASAAVLFDSLDPCIGARKKFKQIRHDALTAHDRAIAMTSAAELTDGYKTAWVEAKRMQLRPIFDEHVAPELTKYGVADFDTAYTTWFDSQLAAYTTQELDALITNNMREDLRKLALDAKNADVNMLGEQKAKLNEQCKMDVANQVFRGTVTVAVTPFGAIARNIEIAKRERGAGAKVLATATGISVDAIEENGGVFGGGLSGGRGSFFRKNLGIRF